MRAHAPRRAVFALSLILVGCGGHRTATHPAPTYERWTLPEWAPPEEDEELPADLSEMEGEWVTEPEEEPTPESAAPGGPDRGSAPESGEATSEDQDAPLGGPSPAESAGAAEPATDVASPDDTASPGGTASPDDTAEK